MKRDELLTNSVKSLCLNGSETSMDKEKDKIDTINVFSMEGNKNENNN